MKNADKPIYPFNEIDWNRSSSEVTTYYSQESGLTKREYFAGLAMQGLLAANNGQTQKYLAKKAIELSDELLKQLENENIRINTRTD